MNKKLIATLVMSSVVASVFAVNAGAAADKKVLKDEAGVTHNVTGKLGKVTGATAEARAVAALEKVKGDFGFTAAKEDFKVNKSHKDEVGTTHTKLDQVINGIPVFGSQTIVHEKNGDVLGVTGSFKALTPDAEETSITADAAIETALNGATPDAAPTAELVYLPTGDQAALAYKVSYNVTFADTPGRFDTFVSAVDGSVLKTINKLETVSATGTGKGVLGDTKTINTDLVGGVYYMKDITKAMYTGTKGWVRTRDMKNGTSRISELTSTDNIWDSAYEAPAVDANFYAGVTYDWYKNNVNRNSIDNAGVSLESLVHYGRNYNNAFWNGTYMVYGDGDGSVFIPLSGSLDVIAHELTHGVTEKTSGLVYKDQSGALNESWSDAMAAVIEGKNWLIGEDIYTPAVAGDALRSMSSPSAYGDPEHMDQFIVTTEDNGGVHSNSGIPNKAFYNFATAIGNRTVAGKIWYTASRDYMTSSTNFSGARAATLQATAALYGSTSSYYTALANAWSAVGVY